MSECCRICLEEDDQKYLIVPCDCKGTQKYVHSMCLYRWQDTMLNNHLNYPERFSSQQILTCRLCGAKHKFRSNDTRWKFLYSASPFLAMIRRYSIMVSVAFGCFIWASSFLFFPFFLNIVTISSLLIAFIWLKGIRPRIFTTGDGVRIGFIRIGVPVPNLRAGMVLRATSVITGGIFYQSRILITKYNSDQGAVGFIINKYRGDLYSDIDQTLHIGGPIQPDSVHVLHSNGTIEGCEEVIEGLYLGGRLNPRPGNMNFKTLYGYSGWSSLQLDGEIRSGVWEMEGAVQVEDLFVESE